MRGLDLFFGTVLITFACVLAVQFITTNLMFLASIVVFNLNPLYTFPIWALFLLIDGAYLSANLFKFLNGEISCLNCQCVVAALGLSPL